MKKNNFTLTEAFSALNQLWETIEVNEHIQDRPAAIESDQKLEGNDNAVIDCQKYDLVAHSEDEKPLDCKMKKAPLEKPLTESDKVREDRWKENVKRCGSAEKLRIEIYRDARHAKEVEFPEAEESLEYFLGQELDARDCDFKHWYFILPDHIGEGDPEYEDFKRGYQDNGGVVIDEALTKDYNVGDKIRIIHLEGEDNSYDGKEGVIEHIDGIGQLHGSWGSLAIIPGVDEFEIITENLEEDTIKQGKDWVNKGAEGTHGKFKTKKAADAQRKAMFANGYKEELQEAIEKKEFDPSLPEHEDLIKQIQAKYDCENPDDIIKYINEVKKYFGSTVPIYKRYSGGFFGRGPSRYSYAQVLRILDSPYLRDAHLKYNSKEGGLIFDYQEESLWCSLENKDKKSTLQETGANGYKEELDEAIKALGEEAKEIKYVLSLYGDECHFYSPEDVNGDVADVKDAYQYDTKKAAFDDIDNVVAEVCDKNLEYMPDDEVYGLFNCASEEEFANKTAEDFLSNGTIEILPVYKNKILWDVSQLEEALNDKEDLQEASEAGNDKAMAAYWVAANFKDFFKKGFKKENNTKEFKDLKKHVFNTIKDKYKVSGNEANDIIVQAASLYKKLYLDESLNEAKAPQTFKEAIEGLNDEAEKNEILTVNDFLAELDDYDKELVLEFKPIIINGKEYQIKEFEFDDTEDGKLILGVKVLSEDIEEDHNEEK